MKVDNKLPQCNVLGDVGLVVVGCPLASSGTASQRHDYIMSVLEAVGTPWIKKNPILLVGQNEKYINSILNTAVSLVRISYIDDLLYISIYLYVYLSVYLFLCNH
jgi:hypothetical protein